MDPEAVANGEDNMEKDKEGKKTFPLPSPIPEEATGERDCRSSNDDDDSSPDDKDDISFGTSTPARTTTTRQTVRYPYQHQVVFPLPHHQRRRHNSLHGGSVVSVGGLPPSKPPPNPRRGSATGSFGLPVPPEWLRGRAAGVGGGKHRRGKNGGSKHPFSFKVSDKKQSPPQVYSYHRQGGYQQQLLHVGPPPPLPVPPGPQAKIRPEVAENNNSSKSSKADDIPYTSSTFDDEVPSAFQKPPPFQRQFSVARPPPTALFLVQ